MTIATFEPPIKVGTVQPTNRAMRRDIAKKQHAGCLVCQQSLSSKDKVVWLDGKSAHKACADAHNERAVQMARDAQLARAKATGLILPDHALLVPPHAARR